MLPSLLGGKKIQLLVVKPCTYHGCSLNVEKLPAASGSGHHHSVGKILTVAVSQRLLDCGGGVAPQLASVSCGGDERVPRWPSVTDYWSATDDSLPDPSIYPKER